MLALSVGSNDAVVEVCNMCYRERDPAPHIKHGAINEGVVWDDKSVAITQMCKNHHLDGVMSSPSIYRVKCANRFTNLIEWV